ncbi:hypothetical protein BASA50_011381 [Batrachochytrium salamandrivorans]|uniref:Hemolysin III family channel protein n=1 Tax=Batrachochytrium salamandrivorans TaxID=1357716 RepID=A0ABQ8EVW8_9FUNG|nr:hypothetical protein BASA60_010931 [Batrachochytrium salamandrivorans]KAH6566486.1 hypothetical protein BASA62_006671 [Batrachochytrium salamandrivorans]KAH6587439.1 hypothetical protein BASA50_011381 [Batrachochytrium salamandrivorans]KAH6602199.1 hypothetical protein BASA61_001359 [Batrachochytrium salamandrivorans]KAH9272386.1 hypothetical protein BASA83_005479 [Batrachochytrium salamandrivorans]
MPVTSTPSAYKRHHLRTPNATPLPNGLQDPSNILDPTDSDCDHPESSSAPSHNKLLSSLVSRTTGSESDSSNITLSGSLSRLFHDSHTKKLREHEASIAFPWWSSRRLIYYKFGECPDYLKDNEFIVSRYRAHYTYLESWISIFHVHNETGNIWSHLAPFFVTLAIMIGHLIMVDLHPNASAIDYAIVSIFLGCVAYTLITSSLFHLHLGVSREAFVFFGCLDYSGISASIFGGSASIAYYFLYCDPRARVGWISALAFINLVGIIGPMFTFWSGSRFRSGRAAVYLSSGACSCAPVIYYLTTYGSQYLPSLSTSFAIPGLLLMMFLYVFGTFIYVMRIPERFAPGYFDCWFHSHMNWHFFVVAASWTLYAALRSMVHWRLDSEHVCPV